ncbi:MAG: glycine--tRNA ligase [Candidatus Lokiarchaeota archaeon]|nr:glycine--tRNA ligase [Candidatus Lokiarchaeota archaeon]
MSSDESSKILMLMSHRGFIYGPSPEIYDAVKGSFDLGPLGKLMKNNLETLIRKIFRKNGFWEVQSPLIGPEIVWKASGHVERFFDYIVQCTKCKNVHRVDTLFESLGYDLSQIEASAYDEILERDAIPCPDCQGKLSNISQQNLMVISQLGFPSSEYILRPETATTTYLLFPRLYQYFRTSMPMFVFQMGYAFRNEISPRKMLLRTREFEQCEGQIFITPEQEINFLQFDDVAKKRLPLWSAKEQLKGVTEVTNKSLSGAIEKGILQKPAYAWLMNLAYEIVLGVGILPENIRFRQHKNDEKAHYAHDAWDLEVNSRLYGWTEVCGVHDRGDYDLSRHQEYSKKKLTVPATEKGEKVIPHILEIAFGIGRLFFFALEQSFRFEEERTVLDLPLEIAPIPFAVFPLQKKPKELIKLAKKIFNELIDNDISAIYDDAGSIGKRYRRTEEVGVRYAFTVDHDSLTDKMVTIRNIEDMSQKRIKIKKLPEIARKLLHGHITYEKIKDLTPSEKQG